MLSRWHHGAVAAHHRRQRSRSQTETVAGPVAAAVLWQVAICDVLDGWIAHPAAHACHLTSLHSVSTGFCRTRLADHSAQHLMLVTGAGCVGRPSLSYILVISQQCCYIPDLQCCCHTPCRVQCCDVPPWRHCQVLASGSCWLAEGGGGGRRLSCCCPKAAWCHQQPTPAQGRQGVALCCCSQGQPEQTTRTVVI
jgi:hypothetical protein